jgi:hypothetical protein
MGVRYYKRRGGIFPDYFCKGLGNTQALPVCQFIPGDHIDRAIGNLLLEVISPTALEVALSVQQEVERRCEEVDRIRRQEVERAQYEADMARRRYMQVDPNNRLVASTLEGDWNERIEALAVAQESYERRRAQDQKLLNDQTREKILSLATDFPRLWDNPKTSNRERKRLVRLVIEDVTLIKADKVSVDVRFRGGATRSLTLPRLRSAFEERRTPEKVVQEIDRLLDDYNCDEVAAILNDHGLRSGADKTFDAQRVKRIQRVYKLPSRIERLRRKGLLTKSDLCVRLGITKSQLGHMRRRGALPVRRHKLTANHYMYDPPDVCQQNNLNLSDIGGAI